MFPRVIQTILHENPQLINGWSETQVTIWIWDCCLMCRQSCGAEPLTRGIWGYLEVNSVWKEVDWIVGHPVGGWRIKELVDGVGKTSQRSHLPKVTGSTSGQARIQSQVFLTLKYGQCGHFKAVVECTLQACGGLSSLWARPHPVVVCIIVTPLYPSSPLPLSSSDPPSASAPTYSARSFNPSDYMAESSTLLFCVHLIYIDVTEQWILLCCLFHSTPCSWEPSIRNRHGLPF